MCVGAVTDCRGHAGDKGGPPAVPIYRSRPLDRRPICLSSIIESNGVGDSPRLNKIFHICAIVNLTCHGYNLRWFPDHCASDNNAVSWQRWPSSISFVGLLFALVFPY